MPVEEGDAVTIEYIGRLDDGTVFDTSKREIAEQTGLIADNPTRTFEPLTVDVGDDRVIPGLQEALLGLEEGEEVTVQIPPEKAYGQYQDEKVGEYERDAFDELIGDRELTEGFEVEAENGLVGEVTAFDDESVTVDFNHELAGERLTFEIEVVSID